MADEQRRRYNIGARKIPRHQRDVSGPVLARREAHYRDVMRSNDDPTVPDGADVAFAAELTEAEAEAFRNASNCRYVEEDVMRFPVPFSTGSEGNAVDTGNGVFRADGSAVEVGDTAFRNTGAYVDANPTTEPGDDPNPSGQLTPSAQTLAYMGASPAEQGPFTGAGVRVAVCDGGTTQALRDTCSWWTMVDRYFAVQTPGHTDPGSGVNGGHGCLVASLAVPPGGELIDIITAFDQGGGAYDSDSARGFIYAADQGAQVVNYSFGGAPDAIPSQVMQDAARYLDARGVQLTLAAGNESLNALDAGSALSRLFKNASSIGAFSETSDTRALFSNYNWDLSGVASGFDVDDIDLNGNLTKASGTSMAAPVAANLIAMLCTGGTYTAQQAAFALRASARQTGEVRDQYGNGVWNLANAIQLLELIDTQPIPENSMQLAMTSLQAIPNNVETRVRYHTIRENEPSIATANTNRDTFTLVQSGMYLITASVRWVGFNNTTGDKFFAIGNNVAWTNSASKRWKTDSRGGTTAPMGMTIMHAQRFNAGDQFCIWVNQGSGITWNLEPTIGVPAADPATLTITRLGA
jgi:hypothetical protein